MIGGFAEALQVADGAGGSATLVAFDRVVDDVDGLNGGWQVVGVLHRADAASTTVHRDPGKRCKRQRETSEVVRSHICWRAEQQQPGAGQVCPKLQRVVELVQYLSGQPLV